MYRCHFCEQLVPPGTPRQTVVIETRAKQYPSRRTDFSPYGGRFRFRDQKRTLDNGGEGREIVKEVSACPACAGKEAEKAAKAEQAAAKAKKAAPIDEGHVGAGRDDQTSG